MRKEREQVPKRERRDDGKYVVKGAVPETGTKITRERISKHYKSLNRENRGEASA